MAIGSVADRSRTSCVGGEDSSSATAVPMGWDLVRTHTHDVAWSDAMQERWDLRRARGRGYWQGRVPGASAGDISYGIEPSTRPTIRTEPTSSSLACSLTAIILSHLIAPLWHSATRTEIRTQASWVDLHCRPTWPWQACFFDHHENEQLLLYRHSNA